MGLSDQRQQALRKFVIKHRNIVLLQMGSDGPEYITPMTNKLDKKKASQSKSSPLHKKAK